MALSDSKYKFFFENSSDAMLIIENGRFVDCNLATVEMLGYTSKQGIVNTPPFELSPEFQPDGRRSAEKAEEMIRVAIEYGNHRFEWDHLKSDGTVVPVEVTLTAVKANGRLHLHTIWRDISKRVQTEREKEESLLLFRYTFEANPDPLIIARTKDGSIVDVNRAFETATGILRNDAIDRNSEQLGLWCNSELRHVFLERLETDREVTNFEADFKVHGGQIKTGLISARIIQVNNEACMLLAIRDNTAEKATKQALVEKNQIKNEFISTAAHELKTPLAAILGFTELLLDPSSCQHLSEEQKTEFLHHILERSEALHRLIKDLLDISYIDSGLPMPMTFQETDLTTLLKKAFNYYTLHEPEHIFELILPEKADGLIINIDRKRICQVLDNLLSNAVKYSPKGSKIILRGELTTNGWTVEIKDHGIGMSPDQVERVFDKFYRANPSSTNVEGLGLGMSIVKQILDEHSGSIQINSTAGAGTTITIDLPENKRLTCTPGQEMSP